MYIDTAAVFILYLLYSIVICLISYGGSLFIIESPYIPPLVRKLENWPITSSYLKRARDIIVKGLRCYTCSGFNIGWIAALTFWILWKFQFSPISILFIFLMGCLGSGFSTLMSYLMSYYFLLLDRKKD